MPTNAELTKQLAEMKALVEGLTSTPTTSEDPPEVTAMIAAGLDLEAALKAYETITGKVKSAKPAAKPAAKGNADKLKAIQVPVFTVEDDNNVKWRLSMAFQSNPKNGDPTVYRSPRVLIESKPQGADDFRKVCTVLPSLLSVIAGLPATKIAAFQSDPREA